MIGSFLLSNFEYLLSVRLDQGTVTSIVEEDGIVKGVKYKTKDGQELTACAPLTIVCDGGFSNLRRNLCKPQVIGSECIDEVFKFPIVDQDVHLQQSFLCLVQDRVENLEYFTAKPLLMMFTENIANGPFCRLMFPHALLV